jgi:hypothetical protein
MPAGRKPPTYAPVDPPTPATAAGIEWSGMLSLPRAARFLGGVSVEFVRDLIGTGQLRAVVVARKLMVPKDELRRYLRELIAAQNRE